MINDVTGEKVSPHQLNAVAQGKVEVTWFLINEKEFAYSLPFLPLPGLPISLCI